MSKIDNSGFMYFEVSFNSISIPSRIALPILEYLPVIGNSKAILFIVFRLVISITSFSRSNSSIFICFSLLSTDPDDSLRFSSFGKTFI